MSSKFLNGSGNVTFEDLSNGSISINANQIQLSNLLPNLPIKADASQKLYSTILQASDVQGVLVNPFNGTIEAKDFETNKYFSVNDELQKINNLDVSTANNTNINGRLHITGEMSIPKITDPTELTRIELDDTDINIISQNLSWNGSDIVSAQGTNQQYIMGDGTFLQYSANSGNSNYYLYNNGTDGDTTPPNGFITYNNINQDDATIIYINHRTRDTIDIEVFFKNLSTLNDVYIQDQENSDNNITYNIIGTPTIINQQQVSIPVVKRTSSGTGSSNFGNGHNLLLSFFTNTIETDTRLSTLENKTRHITATTNTSIFLKSIQFRLTELDRFFISLDEGLDTITKLSISGTQINSLIPMTMSNQKITDVGTPTNPNDAVNKLYVDDAININDGLKLNLTGGTLTGSITAPSFIKTDGLSKDFLKADGSTTTMASITGEMLNNVYFNPNGTILSYSINMDNWRYQSWGYLALSTVSVVDCPTGLMTNIGGSLGNVGIVPAQAPKGYKIRTNSNPPITSNGATCGWLGSNLLNYIIPRAGWYIKIGFSLDATTASGNNRSMVGLFQSTTRPTLDNTITINSITTPSMGIVHERGESVWSFNTRGPSGSIKIPTTISCLTPSNSWYTLELINDPYSSSVVLILSCQTTSNTTLVESNQFVCGTANTMSFATSYIHLQQSMASPGGVNNSALLSLGNIIIRLLQ